MHKERQKRALYGTHATIHRLWLQDVLVVNTS